MDYSYVFVCIDLYVFVKNWNGRNGKKMHKTELSVKLLTNVRRSDWIIVWLVFFPLMFQHFSWINSESPLSVAKYFQNIWNNIWKSQVSMSWHRHVHFLAKVLVWASKNEHINRKYHLQKHCVDKALLSYQKISCEHEIFDSLLIIMFVILLARRYLYWLLSDDGGIG